VGSGGAEGTGGQVTATGGGGGSSGEDEGGTGGTNSGTGGGGTGGSTVAAGSISVSAGTLDRDHTIVSFPLAGSEGKNLVLRDEKGTEIPLQVTKDGTAIFILPSLAKGTDATFTIAEGQAGAAGITATEQGNGVDLKIDTTTVFHFQTKGELPAGIANAYLRGGYIHPLYTPGGVVVTDDWPSDHRHHHGIWSAWTATEFNGHHVDFWNMGMGLGKVDFDSLSGTWQGPVHAGFDTKLNHIDLVPATDVTALHERWVVTVYRTHEGTAPYFIFDLDSTQECATSSPLTLDDYRYGGFAFRGHAQWKDKANVAFLTSEGKDRLAADDMPARWVSIFGAVDGKKVGYAAMGHPSNFRAPQPVRIHPDDPYFNFSPTKGMPASIDPGKPYVSHFRVVTFDGEPNAMLLERLWNDFATPPTVTMAR
jgi:hypothetical protein